MECPRCKQEMKEIPTSDNARFAMQQVDMEAKALTENAYFFDVYGCERCRHVELLLPLKRNDQP